MTPQAARQVQTLLDSRDQMPGVEVTELPAGEGWLMFQLEYRLQEWEDTQPMEAHQHVYGRLA